MTFYEAALEVLRRSGRPLHYKKITEMAIRDALLSHVGKTPEVTMGDRLNQELKREDFSSLVSTRPGVFSLREEIVEKLNKESEERERRERQREERRKKEQREREERERREAQETDQSRDTSRSSKDEDGDEDEDEDDNEESSSSRGGRSRRRGSRRRGSRGRRGRRSNDSDSSDEDEDKKEETSSSSSSKSSSRRSSRSNGTSSDAKKMAYPEDPELFDEPQDESNDDDGDDDNSSNDRSRRRSRGRGRRGRRRSRSSSHSNSDSNQSDSSSSSPSSSKPSSSSRSSSRSSSSRSTSSSNKRNGRDSASNGQSEERQQQSLEDVRMAGLDNIAQAAYTVLRGGDAEPRPIEELSNEIFERKLVRFHTHDQSISVQAALVNDNQVRTRHGQRPVFVHYGAGRWGLTEWTMTRSALEKENVVFEAAKSCHAKTIEHLGRAMISFQAEALEQITLVLLEGMGYREIKVSKRSSNGDVFFSADWRQGLSNVRVCIQLVGDSKEELEQEAVTELRGTLHHYAASEGVIIHFGDVHKQAVKESREEKLAPITLIDRKTFIELLVEQGIGVRTYHVPMTYVDTVYLEQLKTQDA